MKLSVILWLLLGLSSCAHVHEPRTLSEVKGNWDCLRYQEGVSWKQVISTLGEPEIAPLPEAGTDLSRNARVFTDGAVILYLERREVQEEGKTRFQEAVTGLEVCKKKK